jgi:protein-tyrosine-phosphatase
MALGFFERLAGDRAVAWCEGPEPAGRICPAAIAAMAERGIDITGQFRRPWTDQLLRTADVVVAIGHHKAPTVHPGRRYLHWQANKITGDQIDDIRSIRDDIERDVSTLLFDLCPPPVE